MTTSEKEIVRPSAKLNVPPPNCLGEEDHTVSNITGDRIAVGDAKGCQLPE